jgi:hypothetical protein
MEFSGQIIVSACDPFERAGWMVLLPVALWCIPLLFLLARFLSNAMRDFGAEHKGMPGTWLVLSALIIFETFDVNKALAEKGGGGETNAPVVVRAPQKIINLYGERNGKLVPIGMEIRESK